MLDSIPTHYGWICPRCGVVNAPSVQQCFCHLTPNWPNPPAIGDDPTAPIITCTIKSTHEQKQ